MTTPYTITHQRIPEQIVPGRRLGRVVKHDSRNWNYRHQRRGGALVSVEHTRHAPIFNQGNTSSCTGNAADGCLACDPCYAALPAWWRTTMLNETGAQTIYSSAEVIDGDGPFPPQDNGSSGPSVAQAAKNAGLISGYTHCFDVGDVLDALQQYSVILGTNWYTSFDTPSPNGRIVITKDATVRGGHETLWRGYDAENKAIRGDNSWGPGFGLAGSMHMTTDTLERLLAEQGDCTVLIPLTEPSPLPSPA